MKREQKLLTSEKKPNYQKSRESSFKEEASTNNKKKGPGPHTFWAVGKKYRQPSV